MLRRSISFVAYNVPILRVHRRKGPRCSQVRLIEDGHHVVAVIWLKMSVQILLTIGLVNKAMEAISVIPIAVQECYQNNIFLYLEQIRI
jgi:hypothetical protein